MRTPLQRCILDVSSAATILLSVLLLAPPARAQPLLPDDFQSQLIADQLDTPTAFDFLPGERLIVLERVTAAVKLVRWGAGALPELLMVVDSVNTFDEEQGLLGIAVDPGWPVRPFVYMQFNHLDAAVVIARYTASGDLDGTGDGAISLNPASRYLVIPDGPDDTGIHQGGTLRFGPDGMLYSSLGDDGGNCAAQDLTLLQGKILRLDVANLPPTGTGPAFRAQITPPDNPFVANPDSNARLVYAYGLRNPFSFQIDPSNGDLIIADVGTFLLEEIDWAHEPGMNFGWPHYEGTIRRAINCPGIDTTEFVLPIKVFPGHSAMTAGVYRVPNGALIPYPAEYHGQLFYSDFYQFFVRRLQRNGDMWEPAPPVPGQPNDSTWAEEVRWAAAWETGPDGSLWYANMWTLFPQPTGQIRRLVYLPALQVPVLDDRGPLRLRAWPIPAMGTVRFSFQLAERQPVHVSVIDVSGRHVRQLSPRGERNAGRHDLEWDGRDSEGRRAAAGVYFVSVSTPGQRDIRRIVLLGP